MSWDPRDWDWGAVGDFFTGDDPSKIRRPELEHGDRQRDVNEMNLDDVLQRGTPQLQQPTGVRNMQIDLARRMQEIATGQRMGAGEMGVQRQAARAAAQQQGFAASARGLNAAGAARTAANNTARIGVDASGQAAQAALGDQAMANQTLMGTLSSTRGQDTQAAIAQLDATLRARGMDDAARQRYIDNLFRMDATEMQAQLQRDLGVYNPNGMLGPLLQVGGQLGAAAMIASDVRAKENISEADLEELMAKLKAYDFVYKDPERHGKGRQTGIMAQDLEGTKAGAKAVTSAEDGTKMVDYSKLAPEIVAGMTMLWDKLGSLEKGIAGTTTEDLLATRREAALAQEARRKREALLATRRRAALEAAQRRGPGLPASSEMAGPPAPSPYQGMTAGLAQFMR